MARRQGAAWRCGIECEVTASPELRAIAQQLVAPGKGILATDDFPAGIEKRLASVGVISTPDTRRDFREMLFTTPQFADYVSGIILFEETFWNTKLPNVLKGIKLDIGQKTLALSDSELITEGLDGLAKRIAGYKAAGASFAKWRAVLKITDTLPSRSAITTNAHALARYAAICQQEGLVPIVEPDILMDGDHTIERCAEVTRLVLDETFEQLEIAGVDLAAMILKPNMITAGATLKSESQRVAELTSQALINNVPTGIGGIAFLSGGQSEIEATQNLNLIAQKIHATFSFNRALQDTALKTWAGKRENVEAAQTAFQHRLKMNALAAMGQWSLKLESP
jgi:fructose-bisphosphate aldolase, class I